MGTPREPVRYMAVDQWGHTEHGLTAPRRDLLARYKRQSCHKMYIDTNGGQSKHIGYVVAGHWFTVYHVQRLDKNAF